MANDALASGQVVLSASADKLVKDLGQAEQKTKSWAKNFTGSVGNELATELGKRGFAGGVLGGLIGGGIGGGLSEVVANSLGELGVTDWINKNIKGMFEWVSGAEQTREAVEKITAELKAAREEQNKMLDEAAKWRATLVEPADRIADIDGKLAGLSNDWDRLNDRSRALNKELVETERRWGLLTNRSKRLDQISVITQEQNDISQKMKDLIKQRTEMTDPATNLQLVQSISQATTALKQQAETWGMTGEEAQRAGLKARGATDEMLRGFDKAAARLKQLRESGGLPGLGMALDLAGAISHRMSQPGLPGFATMFDVLSGVTSGMPRHNLLADMGAGRLQNTGLPGFGMMFDVLGRVANVLPKTDVFATAFGGSGVGQQSGPTALAAAVEAGTAEGFALAARNRFGGIEGGGDVHRQNGAKLDAIRMSVDAASKKIEDILRGVGML